MFKKEIFNWILLEKIFVICWKILLNFTRFLFGSKLHFFCHEVVSNFTRFSKAFGAFHHLATLAGVCKHLFAET